MKLRWVGVMASPDDLIRRVKRAIKATENNGHHLISGEWLSYNPDNGTFCGCALGFVRRARRSVSGRRSWPVGLEAGPKVHL